MLRDSYSVGLRHSIECWPLGGECRVWVEVALSIISRLFMGVPYRLGLLAFKGNGKLGMCMALGGVYFGGKP